MMVANGDASGVPEDRVDDFLKRYREGYIRETEDLKDASIHAIGDHDCTDAQVMAGLCTCEQFGFCRTPCDICKTPDHGDRFSAMVLYSG